MSKQGYTGISFPFRIGVKGGVAMSTTSVSDVQHIVEAMEQILLTRPFERGMEPHFKSDIDSAIFSPNDESTRTLIEYQVKEALSTLEDRITILSVNVSSEGTTIYATIRFRVPSYESVHTTTLKVGESIVQSTD